MKRRIRQIRRRGEPLLVLAAILGLWIAIRVILWAPPYVPALPGLALLHPPRAAGRHHPAGGEAMPMPDRSAPRPWRVPMLAPRPPASEGRLDGPPLARPQLAAAQQMLWMAAMADLPSPGELLAGDPRDTVLALGPARLRAAPERRWSADGWLMWRRGGEMPASGLAPSTYGASQGGMILRYRLAPSSPLRPTLYLRGTGAMDGSGEADSAFGFSVRPLARLPVSLAVEGRLSRLEGGRVVARPAVMAVTELMPQPMPLSMRLEAYAAAGYVGGPGGTAFVDGQLRVDHHVASFGPAELRAGGGVWGGAQHGAGRLDMGPSASVGVREGRINARLAVDWRLRVAGTSQPASGPAVTLATGF